MENAHIKNLSLLLFATLCVSTSGFLGKYIELSTEVIIWFRAILSALFLFIYCKVKKVDVSIKSKKHIAPFIVSAVFMAGHWLTYFYALKLSNVAIGMLSLFTFPVIITLLEPLFVKAKFNPIHLILALLVILGIYILAPEFTLESNETKGVLFGVLSALFYALRILILKQQVANYNASMLMLYQTVIITIILIPVLFYSDLSNIQAELPYLLLLALVTTAIGHTLLVNTLHYFSASTASIISSVQPIFGIFIAFIFADEIPKINTYVGGSLILLTVVIESIRSSRKKV